jgi:tetratricopeptide (TPR) repeat protein
MRRLLIVWIAALLAACAGPQALAPRHEQLFDDALFGAPSERIGTGQVFALSEPMRHYLNHDIAAQLRSKGPQRGLLDALYQRGELKLDYDASVTRTAAQAFADRAGNCLSLVIMTAAFAREMGLVVRYHSAYLEEAISRNHNLLLRSGHVNLSLGRSFADSRSSLPHTLTVDFLPPEELRGLRTIEIPEETVLAMFMNNRAVEAIVGGRLNDAYAWAREALRKAPDFIAALNTLGVVYLRKGHLPQAAAVFDHVLERDTMNRPALSNLTLAYARMGRVEDSARLQQRLARLEPDPPFHFFNLGLAAMKKHDYSAAREHFAREVARGDGYHEFHYWLGLAHVQLGNVDQARRHLSLALENSTSQKDRSLYSSKLDWLRAKAQPAQTH